MKFSERLRILLAWAVLITLLWVTTGTISVARCQDIDKGLVERSSVTFVGTVVKLKSVSFAQVPVSDKTAVVRVDAILDKPETVSIKIGQEITLQLKDPTLFRQGTRATFYADGWILGDGIALLEVGHTFPSVSDSLRMAQQVREKFVEVKRQIADAKIRSQIDSADVVALGQVIDVRPAAKAVPGRKFVTEHDPDWQEATIRIQRGLKGVTDGEEIVARFPGSADVAFYRLPKFKAGEERIIFLVKDQVSGLPKAMLQGKQVDAYTIPKGADLLTKEDFDRVQRIAKQR